MKKHLLHLMFTFQFSKKKGNVSVIFRDGSEPQKKLHHTDYSNEKDQPKIIKAVGLNSDG